VSEKERRRIRTADIIQRRGSLSYSAGPLCACMCVNVCLCECVYLFVCVCVCVCVCDLSGNENAPRCDLHKTCTARHKLQHRPAPFIYLAAYFCYVFFFFLPVILVYRLFRYNNVAGFGWVGDFVLVTRLHTVCIIYLQNTLVYLIPITYICIYIYYKYYTILLFLLGRVDIGILLQLTAKHATFRRTLYIYCAIDPPSR
jgi:hypothetical protein